MHCTTNFSHSPQTLAYRMPIDLPLGSFCSHSHIIHWTGSRETSIYYAEREGCIFIKLEKLTKGTDLEYTNFKQVLSHV